ncbi:TfoX/Sxy family protein [Amycolatopsis jejuensis]|uniref:TfoX/Sxy family protein n=1 Tax=Amycolatopsis jejuensis TaxID=330084 RepID=UPI0005246542|nr:TfoX/Sxy family protein [Amycolatopsis jejuensis]
MTEEQFEDLVDELQHCPGVTPPRPGQGFGSHALKVHGRMFAVYVRGRLVVKLPKPRVDELVAQGHGVRFDANKGTPMKEWFSMDPEAELEWTTVVREAMKFVGG